MLGDMALLADERPVVIFDVFDTLFRFDGDHVDDQTWCHVATWLQYEGVSVDAAKLAKTFASVKAAHRKGSPSRTPDVEVTAVWADVLARFGHNVPDEMVLRLAKFWRVITTHHIEAWPGMPALVEKVAEGYRVAVASNTQRAYTQHELEMLGYGGLFSAVAFSSDLAACKPDPAVIRSVLEQTGVSPDRAVYIGDHGHDDVPAAAGAGVACILLDRGRAATAPKRLKVLDVIADVEIDRVFDVIAAHLGPPTPPPMADGSDVVTIGSAEIARRISETLPGQWVDLRNTRLVGHRFGDRDNTASVAALDLSGAELIECSFANTTMRGLRFQEATLTDCDLRYADIESTSFKRARLAACDLYRARLGHDTIFEGADLSSCSLNMVSFDGAVLPREAVAAKGALLQERTAEFTRFHQGLLERSRGDIEAMVPLHLARARQEAAAVWRNLSAHWASTGATRDSAFAYVRARTLETAATRPDRVIARRKVEAAVRPEFVSDPKPARATARWLSGSLAGLVAGHGESPSRVVWSVVAVVAVFAGIFAIGDLANPLLFSCQSLVASADTSDSARWVQWAVTIETTFGIGLLGLLGFCLGNRVRSA